MKKVNIVFLSKSEFGNVINPIHDFKMDIIPNIGHELTFDTGVLIDSNDEVLGAKNYKVVRVQHFVKSFSKKLNIIYVK